MEQAFLQIVSGVRSGQVVWLLNSPASALAATLSAADGVLACDDDVVIPRGRAAAFVTWGCAAAGGGCQLVPL